MQNLTILLQQLAELYLHHSRCIMHILTSKCQQYVHIYIFLQSSSLYNCTVKSTLMSPPQYTDNIQPQSIQNRQIWQNENVNAAGLDTKHIVPKMLL